VTLGAWSLAYGDRDVCVFVCMCVCVYVCVCVCVCVCVSSLVDCSSLTMHGEISSVLRNTDGLVLTCVPGVWCFHVLVLSLGGCKFIWVVAFTM